MKTSLFSLSVLMIFASLFSLAQANVTGNEHGNGGGAIVCRDANKKIISAELLDLFEAKVGGAQFTASDNSVDLLTSKSLQRFSMNNPFFAARIRQALKDNLKIRIDIPEGVSILPPDDAFPWLQKNGCQLEGVAQYRSLPDGDRLYIDPQILNAMPPIDQAALWMHEAVYKVLRETDGDQNSLRARYMVAQAFADKPVPLALPDQNRFFSCFSGSPQSGELKSFTLMGFLQNSQFHVWITRNQDQWLFPAVALPEDQSTNPDFGKLIRYVFEGVGSQAEWNTFPDEVVTAMPTTLASPKAFTMRLAKAPYTQFAPVYQLRMFLGAQSPSVCAFSR